MSTTVDTWSKIVAVARRRTGMTAAEFDYSLSLRGPALAALSDAAYVVANAGHRTPDEATTPEELREYAERGAVLYRSVQPRVAEMIEAAQDRSYAGWSEASPGPIRYAD